MLKQQIERLEKQIDEAETLQAAGFHAAEQAGNNEALVRVAHLERIGVVAVR